MTTDQSYARAREGQPAQLTQLTQLPQVNGHKPAPNPPVGDPTRHLAAQLSRAWLAAVPVVLVNAVAFGAQLGFWRATLPLWQAVMVAFAAESIAVYLAWHAHLAQRADDSAFRLRLAAYGMALVIGTLNYSHYMLPGWRPTVAAVTFGLMSAISPWLWAVHSRRESRDVLRARGDIEPHAVRLGVTRWSWHPIRSCRVMFRATWQGVTKPGDAIALLPAARRGEIARDTETLTSGAPPRKRESVTRKRESPGGMTNAERARREGVPLSTWYRRRAKGESPA